MERVLGIGGFYFRASNPERLAAWYATCLGIDLRVLLPDTLGWTHQGLRLPLQLDRQEVPPPAPGPRQWMLNFRVRDLDAMVRQLTAQGIAVQLDPDDHDTGRFARFSDPEGNPVAIWELYGLDARE